MRVPKISTIGEWGLTFEESVKQCTQLCHATVGFYTASPDTKPHLSRHPRGIIDKFRLTSASGSFNDKNPAAALADLEEPLSHGS